MPENAKVGIIEDDGEWVDFYQEAVDIGGHKTVAKASTLDEARKIIEKVSRGELHLDVVLIDNNLGENKDVGLELVEAFNQLGVKTIGVPNKFDLAGASAMMLKENFSEREMARLISELQR